MEDVPGKQRHVLVGIGGISLATILVLGLLYSSAGPDLADASLGSRIAGGGRAILEHLGTLLRDHPEFLLPLLVCELAVQLSKGLKWTAILRTVHPVRYSSALSGVVVGAAATHLIPFRLDELLRTGVVARREGIAPALVFGTVLVDRIVDVFILGCLLAALSLFLVDGLEGPMATACWILGVGFVVVVVGCLALLRWESSLVARLPESPLGQRIAGWLVSLAQGLRSIPRGRNLVLLAVGVIGEWTATILFYLLILAMAGVLASPALSVILALGNSISYAVPGLPGALGLFEWVQGSMLSHIGNLPRAEANALALSAHAILMLPVTLAGLVVGLLEWRKGLLLHSGSE
ncbi:MAG: lysylphosphatidylglycerol synthase transmembrane domain-containing protein [Myxococcota bacterium]|nr:lysylphosphatidylglycerol synthase transmembrane domain-containing protein [Myxococcota bacterium]